MVSILDEVPSFGTRFARGLGLGASQGLNQGMQFAQQMALQGSRKKEEDLGKFATGLDVISQMKDIAAKRNIGRGSSFLGFFPTETARDRAEYAQLGKSLIPLVAAGVPIRNQKEFEEYKKVITDPSASLSEIEGALGGLENIFKSKIMGSSGKPQKIKIKFDISNPEHKARRNQVLKKAKGNQEKAQQVLLKEFEL